MGFQRRTLLIRGITIAISGGVFASLPSITRAAVVSSDAAVYAGPGDWFEVVSYVSAGTSVSLDGPSVDGYFPVTADGVSGYIPTWLVTGEGTVASNDSYGADSYAADSYTAGSYTTDSYTADAPSTDSYAPEAADSYTADAAGGDTYTPAPVEPAHSNQSTHASSGDGDLNPPAGQSTAAGGGSEYSESEILSIIYDAAVAYGQNGSAMERVARCESGLNPYAINPRGFYGLFQFHPNTFAGTPFGDRDIFDPYANANAAAWMWQQGRKNEWACQ